MTSFYKRGKDQKTMTLPMCQLQMSHLIKPLAKSILQISSNSKEILFRSRKMNLWVHIWELRERSPDQRSPSLPTSTSVKNIEKNWKRSIQSGLHMKLWSMWVQSGLIWTSIRSNPTTIWQLMTRNAMISSSKTLLTSHQTTQCMWLIWETLENLRQMMSSCSHTIILMKLQLTTCSNPVHKNIQGV